MNDLPALYNRVTAKRPELAVEGLRTLEVLIPKSDQTVAWWCGHRGIGSGTAAAMILAKWVEALPQYTWLGHDGDPINGWKVRGLSDGDNYEIIIVMTDAKRTPLEALAAFYLGEVT